MKILWLERGEKSLNRQIRHIEKDNPNAAKKMLRLIDASVQGLAQFPYTGRIGRIAGTRELVVSPYVIAYRIRKDHIEILHVLYGAQDWPTEF